MISAVLVLYRQTPEASESLSSLRQMVLAQPQLAGRLELLVYDNSPQAQALPELPFAAEYVHNAANPGLAVAYNAALARAVARGNEWLLLLDQDTELTAEWLGEALATLPDALPEVVAVLPQLVEGGHVHSPQRLPRLSSRALPAGFSGVVAGEITAFNSGALLRVSAVSAIHGFPTGFPLDFLDHATFHLLAAGGGHFHVLRAQLAHQLSTTTLGGDASLARYRKILAAERDFYAAASGSDAAWYRLRRGKQALGHLLKVKDKRFAWLDLRAALGLLRD